METSAVSLLLCGHTCWRMNPELVRSAFQEAALLRVARRFSLSLHCVLLYLDTTAFIN